MLKAQCNHYINHIIKITGKILHFSNIQVVVVVYFALAFKYSNNNYNKVLFFQESQMKSQEIIPLPKSVICSIIFDWTIHKQKQSIFKNFRRSLLLFKCFHKSLLNSSYILNTSLKIYQFCLNQFGNCFSCFTILWQHFHKI